MARLFPAQGQWDEADYLALTADTNRLVELCDGSVEVLPMPKTSHQRLVAYLYGLLSAFVAAGRLGTVLFAPLRVRLREGLIREPDIVFMRAQNARRIGEDFWDGADLIVEVVSGGEKDRAHDTVVKRREYARAGIPECWIVDPEEARVTVLKLAKGRKAYVVHGAHQAGGRAASALLPGFSVDVAELWAAGRA